MIIACDLLVRPVWLGSVPVWLGSVPVWRGVVSAAGGSDPGEAAGFWLDELPEVMLLEDVMEAAQAAEVARGGLAALIEWDAMIEIAAPDGLAAGGEATGSVTGGDEVAEPGWRGVGGAGQGVGAAARGRVGEGVRPGVGGCRGRRGLGAFDVDRQDLA